MSIDCLVSVIIPCYNREVYINETIESVLNQNYPKFELIVVDDGSRDKSYRILESYGDRILLLSHAGRINLGQSASINVGLRHAKGEFIAILDSDDLFLPGKLEKQVNYLKENERMGIVYSNGMIINAEGKELYPLYTPGPKPPIGPEHVLEYSAFNLPSNAMVRKSIFDKAGYLDETFRTAQDHDMAVRLAEIAPVGYLDEILWCYRRHKASVSSQRTMERWRNGFIILDRASGRYRYPLATRLRRRAILHFRMGQCYWKDCAYFAALGHFFAAGMLDPVRSIKVGLGLEKVNAPSS